VSNGMADRAGPVSPGRPFRQSLPICRLPRPREVKFPKLGNLWPRHRLTFALHWVSIPRWPIGTGLGCADG
jgi:hypothetical protein